jgi:spore germination protein YaaH
MRTILILGVIGLIWSCDQGGYSSLQRSVRRTESQISSVDSDLDRMKRRLGLTDSKTAKADSLKEAIIGSFESIEQKNMLNRYGYLYDFLNPADKNVVSSSNFYWDSTNQIYYVKNENIKKRNPQYEVFGWHPYWMGDSWKSYSFELISSISYFSYKVNPHTGGYTNPNQIEEWKSTEMINEAKKAGTRVLLSIANHGIEQNRIFLNNEEAWNGLIDSVANLINLREADGVDVNFEEIAFRDRWAFVSFIEQLRRGLNLKVNRINPFIAVTLPAHSNRTSFEINALEKQIDLFVIMGYDYHKGRGKSGAVAPLRTEEADGNSLQKTVDYYLKKGINAEKTVLALPYYGAMWKGALSKSGFLETYFDKQVTYREIMSLYSSNYVPQLDITSMTKYHFLEFQDKTSIELWYDDAYTMARKFDFALSNGLKGIGVWALGYDNGYTDFWEVLNEKFTTDTIMVNDPIAEAEGYPIKMGSILLQYEKVMVVSFLMFAMAVIFGFLIAFNDWRVRESVFGNQLYRFLWMLIIIVLLIPILGMMNWFGDDRWKLLLAFLLGVIIFYFINRMQVSFRSDKP